MRWFALAVLFLAPGCPDRALPISDRISDMSSAPGPDRAARADLGATIDLARADLAALPDLAIPPITEFTIPTDPTPYGAVGEIVSGADGNLWFTEAWTGQIGRITVAGAITEFPLPNRKSHPQGVARGPDGNVWFAEAGASAVGRITPSGAIDEFPLSGSALPTSICNGPDANLWLTDSAHLRVFRVAVTGVATSFPLAPLGSLGSIVAGPDGRLWVNDDSTSTVYTIAVDGTPGPTYYVAGDDDGFSDGRLWASTNAVWAVAGNALDRLTPASQTIVDMSLGSYYYLMQAVIASDGTIWFGERYNGSGSAPDLIGARTPTGAITTYPLAAGVAPSAITIGPDGNIWFIEVWANRIGRLRR